MKDHVPFGKPGKARRSVGMGRLAETNGFVPTSKLSAFKSSFAAQKNEHIRREGDEKVTGNDKTAKNQAVWNVLSGYF